MYILRLIYVKQHYLDPVEVVGVELNVACVVAATGESPVAETPVAGMAVAETPVAGMPVAETRVGETRVAETPIAETRVAEGISVGLSAEMLVELTAEVAEMLEPRPGLGST